MTLLMREYFYMKINTYSEVQHIPRLSLVRLGKVYVRFLYRMCVFAADL